MIQLKLPFLKKEKMTKEDCCSTCKHSKYECELDYRTCLHVLLSGSKVRGLFDHFYNYWEPREE